VHQLVNKNFDTPLTFSSKTATSHTHTLTLSLALQQFNAKKIPHAAWQWHILMLCWTGSLL